MIRDIEVFLTIIKILFEKHDIKEMDITPEQIEAYRMQLLEVTRSEASTDSLKIAKVHIIHTGPAHT